MDLIERIDELQVLVEEAKAVPLSSSVVINREEVLELLTQLKDIVPEEVRQARWMSRDRDELLDRARKEGERIIQEAREQRDRLLSRTEIVHAAQREGEKIVAEAHDRSTKIRIEAEDYIDHKLAQFEILLNKTLSTVARGREQIRADAPTGAVPQMADSNDNGDEAAGQPMPFDAASNVGQPAF